MRGIASEDALGQFESQRCLSYPDLPAQHRAPPRIEYDFKGATLPSEFQWLRTPHPERLFTMTGNALRLTGRESLGSWFEQSLVARRQEEPAYSAEADFIADPKTWQQAAGLITYYNRHKFHAALITHEDGERVVTILSCLGDWPGEALTFHSRTAVRDGTLTLGVVVDHATQRFSVNGDPVGPELDAALVSDEGGRGEHAAFTGAFGGVVAYDGTGLGGAGAPIPYRGRAQTTGEVACARCCGRSAVAAGATSAVNRTMPSARATERWRAGTHGKPNLMARPRRPQGSPPGRAPRARPRVRSRL